MPLDEIECLSKTTKLLLLDSLLQEVCIESGSHVSHNLLYSGLKKAHSKKKSFINRTTYTLKCVVEILCKESCFLLVGSLLNGHMSWRRRQHLTKGFGCPLDPPASPIGSDSVRVMATKGKTMQNVYSNLYSQAVTHPSTNRSRPCLTSVIGRELVHSRWYGRRHPSRGKILMQNLKNSGTRFSDFCCINVQFLRLELPSCWNFC